eukprot:599063-Pelagomonas_calceolata.AAC.6
MQGKRSCQTPDQELPQAHATRSSASKSQCAFTLLHSPPGVRACCPRRRVCCALSPRGGS